jgi:hypothetical protein
MEMTLRSLIVLGLAATGVAQAVVREAAPPYPYDGAQCRRVSDDAPAGWGTSCWQGPTTYKMNYHVWFEDIGGDAVVSLEDLFGAGHGLTVADLEKISFQTKKDTNVPISRDFWVTIYTKLQNDSDNSSTWFDSRLNALPDEGPGYMPSFVYDEWNLWSTDDGESPTNQLRFYDSGRNYWNEYVTLDQLATGDIDWTAYADHDYSEEELLAISIHTDSGWNGFDGTVDALTIVAGGMVGEVDLTDGITREVARPAVADEKLPRVVSGAPVGWGTDCWQGPATGKINYHVYHNDDEKLALHGAAVSLDDLFGVGHGLTVGDLKNLSFLTKKGAAIPADRDFWITIYTKFEDDGFDSFPANGWYDSRLHARPDVGTGYSYTTDPDAWRLWSTDAAASSTNALLFYESARPGMSGYATLTEIAAGPADWNNDLVADHDYSGEEILSLTIQTDTGWDGFDGYIDGLSIELKDGRLGEVDFSDGPHLELVAHPDSLHISVDDNGCAPNLRVSVQLDNLDGEALFSWHTRITFPTSLNAQSLTMNPNNPWLFHSVTGTGTDGGVLDVVWSQGGTTPSAFEGELFSIDFWGDDLENLASQIQITLVDFRSPRSGGGYNVVPVLAGPPLTVVVDDSVPTFDAGFPDFPDVSCIGGDFTVEVEATDNVDLDKVQYRFDNTGIWIDAISGISGGSLAGGSFLADVSGLTDNSAHTIQVRLVDDVCYTSSEASWAFTLDTVPAVVINSLQASPRHHGVQLTWTGGNGSDALKVYRFKRETYPYFGGRPNAGTPATLVATLPGGSTSHFDNFILDTDPTRGIYDYALVTYDCANDSLTSNIASATNYFLGDWAGNNGGVCSADLTFLSGYYGDPSTAGLSDELDVAPTSDYTAFGLPGPDGQINFEDLVIFAINYNLNCDPPLSGSRVEAGKDAVIATASRLVLNRVQDGQVEITLDGSLMAYSLRIISGQGLLAADCGGALVMSYPSAEGWVIDVAGNGGMLAENAVLRLNLSDSKTLALEVLAARDGLNAPVDLALDLPEVEALPTSYSLGQNYPNPFNPTTTVRFGLPEEAQVRLTVYNTLGQQVRTLVSGPMTAGWHEVQLDGSDLASGVYFYRLQADHYTDLRRMVLVK